MILEEKEQEKSKIFGSWILLLRLCFKFIIFTCYQTSSDCICIYLNLKPLTVQCIYLVHYFKRRFFVIGAWDLCVYYRNENLKKLCFSRMLLQRQLNWPCSGIGYFTVTQKKRTTTISWTLNQRYWSCSTQWNLISPLPSAYSTSLLGWVSKTYWYRNDTRLLKCRKVTWQETCWKFVMNAVAV
mgnify:CR=1 FL=1